MNVLQSKPNSFLMTLKKGEPGSQQQVRFNSSIKERVFFQPQFSEMFHILCIINYSNKELKTVVAAKQLRSEIRALWLALLCCHDENNRSQVKLDTVNMSTIYLHAGGIIHTTWNTKEKQNETHK